SAMIVTLCALYYGVLAIQAVFGADAGWPLAGIAALISVGTVWLASRYPDLELDDPNAPIIHVPRAWHVTRTGLDFLLPLIVLLWCLMVDQLSPGLSAFWGCATLLGIVVTR